MAGVMAARFSGAVLIVLLAAGSGPTAAVPGDPIAGAADRYAAGDHDGAVAAFRNSPGLKVAELTTGLERWIAAAQPGHRDGRGRLAAAFALDVVWHSKGPVFRHGRLNYDPHGRVSPSDPELVPSSALKRFAGFCRRPIGCAS
jgi:hypothetical protein